MDLNATCKESYKKLVSMRGKTRALDPSMDSAVKDIADQLSRLYHNLKPNVRYEFVQHRMLNTILCLNEIFHKRCFCINRKPLWLFMLSTWQQIEESVTCQLVLYKPSMPWYLSDVLLTVTPLGIEMSTISGNTAMIRMFAEGIDDDLPRVSNEIIDYFYANVHDVNPVDQYVSVLEAIQNSIVAKPPHLPDEWIPSDLVGYRLAPTPRTMQRLVENSLNRVFEVFGRHHVDNFKNHQYNLMILQLDARLDSGPCIRCVYVDKLLTDYWNGVTYLPIETRLIPQYIKRVTADYYQTQQDRYRRIERRATWTGCIVDALPQWLRRLL